MGCGASSTASEASTAPPHHTTDTQAKASSESEGRQTTRDQIDGLVEVVNEQAGAVRARQQRRDEAEMEEMRAVDDARTHSRTATQRMDELSRSKDGTLSATVDDAVESTGQGLQHFEQMQQMHKENEEVLGSQRKKMTKKKSSKKKKKKKHKKRKSLQEHQDDLLREQQEEQRAPTQRNDGTIGAKTSTDGHNSDAEANQADSTVQRLLAETADLDEASDGATNDSRGAAAAGAAGRGHKKNASSISKKSKSKTKSKKRGKRKNKASRDLAVETGGLGVASWHADTDSPSIVPVSSPGALHRPKPITLSSAAATMLPGFDVNSFRRVNSSSQNAPTLSATTHSGHSTARSPPSQRDDRSSREATTAAAMANGRVEHGDVVSQPAVVESKPVLDDEDEDLMDDILNDFS